VNSDLLADLTPKFLAFDQDKAKEFTQQFANNNIVANEFFENIYLKKATNTTTHNNPTTKTQKKHQKTSQ